MLLYYIIAILIIFWAAISIVLEVTISGQNLLTPSHFYQLGLNWFGAWTVTLLIAVVSPFMAIFKFLRWVFTVGR